MLFRSLILSPGAQQFRWVVHNAGVWDSFCTAFGGLWTRLVGPVSLWASSAILGKSPVPPGNGLGLNPLKLYPPPSSNTDQPKESLSLPPCLLLMPLHREVSSRGWGWADPGPEEPMASPVSPHTSPSPLPHAMLCKGIATVSPLRGRKRKPSMSTCGGQGEMAAAK